MYQLKYLYAEHIYGWRAEQLSNYISFLGITRAIFLLLLLPCKPFHDSLSKVDWTYS